MGASWYRLNYSGDVSRIEVLRDTDQFVVIKDWTRERRINKAGEFFPTFNELKKYLIEKRQRQVNSLEDQLVYARKQLAKAEEMQDVSA